VDETIAPLLKTTPEIKSKIESIDTSSDSLKKSDQESEDSNNKIISKTIKVLIITSIVVFSAIFILFTLSKNESGFFKRFNLKEITIESLVILVFVGITEYVFLTYFGSRFIAIDVNKIKISLLEKIKQYLNG